MRLIGCPYRRERERREYRSDRSTWAGEWATTMGLELGRGVWRRVVRLLGCTEGKEERALLGCLEVLG
jgi:hypothetical protein